MAKLSSVLSTSCGAIVNGISSVNDLIDVAHTRSQKWVERERITSSYNSYVSLVSDFNEISSELNEEISKFNAMHTDNQINAGNISKAIKSSIDNYAKKLNIDL